MIAENFSYAAPSSIQDAIALLHEHGDDAKILAGGHSLIPMMKLRFASPTHLIDINNIPGLSYIKEENGVLKIGAMTREVEVEESDLLNSKYHIFADATKLIADPQVRNFGITTNSGTREVSLDDFFMGFYTTAVEHGEILTEIRIPAASGRFGSAYHKAERKVGDYATAGVAAVIQLDNDGVCTRAGLGLTNVSPTPMRVSRAEELLLGSRVSAEDIATAAKMASEDCSPSDDLRGDEDYKRHLVKVITKRMLNKALSRAK